MDSCWTNFAPLHCEVLNYFFNNLTHSSEELQKYLSKHKIDYAVSRDFFEEATAEYYRVKKARQESFLKTGFHTQIPAGTPSSL